MNEARSIEGLLVVKAGCQTQLQFWCQRCVALVTRIKSGFFLFLLGKRGKSIRTKTSWMTPVEFMNEGLGHRNGVWRKDIENNGKALGFLLEVNVVSGVSETTRVITKS